MPEYNTSDLIVFAAEAKALEFNTAFEDILKEKLQEAVANKKYDLSKYIAAIEEETLEGDWYSINPYLKKEPEKEIPPKPKRKPKLNITKPREDYYPPASKYGND